MESIESRQNKKNECSLSLGTKENSSKKILLTLVRGILRFIEETNKEPRATEKSEERRHSTAAKRTENSFELADCSSLASYVIAGQSSEICIA